MYSTCLFCHAPLGANEAIEHFPVGRRLAFDAAKGRLWVVCKRCLRWNLTPLEERWEAIEECERLFRETRLRVSTDNVGMARVREGLELVRIGPALRPEIVAWRYGALNDRRRRRAQVISGVGLAAGFGGVFLVGPALGVSAGFLSWKLANYATDRIRALIKAQYGRVRLATDAGVVALQHQQAAQARLVTDTDGRWALRVPLDHHRVVDFTGAAARQRLATLLTAVNLDGVRPQALEAGERILTDAGDAEGLLRRLSRPERALPPGPVAPDASPYYYRRRATGAVVTTAWTLGALAEGNRAALEMAVNEENERRAMEGELAALEDAWREAEEIAAIADNLFLGSEVDQRFESLKRRGT